MFVRIRNFQILYSPNTCMSDDNNCLQKASHESPLVSQNFWT